ncbi:hypothetical protein MNBD_PLANCTO02-1031 [hydrothermal vent metagenome]|uniref:O-antigen ligase-related domain-containing protein n=1 Tax=hydrothermal vent metagenome TaxID=652676 RepID=A0A3B1DNL9_9ZZZZ
MTSSMVSNTASQQTSSIHWKLGTGILTGTALLSGLLISQPLLTCALILLIGGGWILFRYPLLTIPVVLFLMYSNIAVVAMNFHNVPGIVTKAVPALLGWPLLYSLVIRREGIVIGPSFIWILGFGIIQLIGTLFSARPEISWDSLQTFLLEGIVLYLLITNLVRTPSQLRHATWGLLIAGCLMGGVPLLQQVTGNFDNEYGGFAQTGGEPGFGTGQVTVAGEINQKRLSGPIGEKNRYAQVMLMLIPLGLYRMRHEKKKWLKLLAFVAMTLASVGALLAFSRSTMLVIGLVILFAACMGYVNTKRVLLGGIICLMLLLLTPQYRTRMASLANLGVLASSGQHSSADGALKGRATEMGAAALVFLDYPLVGVGPGMFKYVSREYGERIGYRALKDQRQAHNLLLGVAAETGLPGLVCLLAVFWVIVSNLNRAYHSLRYSSPVLAETAIAFCLVIVAYFGSGLFLHFAFIRYFWMMIALADCCTLILLQHQKTNNTPQHFVASI